MSFYACCFATVHMLFAILICMYRANIDIHFNTRKKIVMEERNILFPVVNLRIH